MRYLETEEIIDIHDLLVQDFAESADPISPPGIKNLSMLESAAARQATGFGGYVKYETVDAVASTLLYGIVNNHPFHNGNKRTGLVTTLTFLDRNDRTLDGVSHNDLYDIVTKVAAHTVCHGGRARADEEVEELRRWIRRHSRPQTRGERVITYRQLRRILGRFGYDMKDPKDNTIDVIKVTTEKRLGMMRTVKHRTNIAYPGDNYQINKQTMKDIRERLGLSDRDGFDADAFYDHRTRVDMFIVTYQSLLRRLAKT